MDAVAWVTLAVFIVGTVFYAGQLSARVSAIEKNQDTMQSDLTAIRRTTDKIAARFMPHVVNGEG